MQTTLVIACGAIAHELVAVKKANNWHAMTIQCLPAHWHNTPQFITPGVEQLILDNRSDYEHIFVAYGDCGTGGQLDALLDKHQVSRLPGAHCYSFFAGQSVFERLSEKAIGTFYLTDYLVDHFDRLILDGLGITKHPELKTMMFAHYTHLVYLAQDETPPTLAKRTTAAESAAASLNLTLEVVKTGLQPFAQAFSGIPIAVANPL